MGRMRCPVCGTTSKKKFRCVFGKKGLIKAKCSVCGYTYDRLENEKELPKNL